VGICTRKKKIPKFSQFLSLKNSEYFSPPPLKKILKIKKNPKLSTLESEKAKNNYIIGHTVPLAHLKPGNLIRHPISIRTKSRSVRNAPLAWCRVCIHMLLDFVRILTYLFIYLVTLSQRHILYFSGPMR